MNIKTNNIKPLAVYIHWPFCLKKCPYCDFNSHVREEVEQARWQTALLRELDWTAEQVKEINYQAVSIFFGGGTPSLMPADTVAAIIEKVRDLWGTKTQPQNNKIRERSERTSALSLNGDKTLKQVQGNDIPLEITLEANPTSSEAKKFKAFRDAGVNRLSLGVQSLRDDALLQLGREHSAKEALKAVELAASIFPRYSFDLIYARPEQTLKEWEAELREALTYADGHLSLYQLTIENGTAFKHLHDQGKLIIPKDDLAADFYQLTGDIVGKQQMSAYEISNYAKAGQESHHNLAYWRGESYVGIGAGAHGRVQGLGLSGQDSGASETSKQERELLRPTSATARAALMCRGCVPPERIQYFSTQNLKSPERWLSQVESKGHGMEQSISLSTKDRAEEAILSGLRLRDGINKEYFEQQFEIPLDSLINSSGLTKMQKINMAENSKTTIKLTQQGLLLLDSVAAELLA